MSRLPYQIGMNWWAQQWLRTLEGFGEEYQRRLMRGQADARHGSVLRMTLQPGHVIALVRGSSTAHYQAQLWVATFAAEVWEKALRALAQQPLLAAKLLARELPQDITGIFDELGVALFPVSPKELETSCTCADWISPCKHVAAVNYVLAERMDADPFALLTLRGRSEANIISALRTYWQPHSKERNQLAGEDATSTANMDAPMSSHSARQRTAPLRVVDFYTAGTAYHDAQPDKEVSTEEVSLLKRLGRPPFAEEGEDPIPLLTSAYNALARHALHTLQSSDETPDLGN